MNIRLLCSATALCVPSNFFKRETPYKGSPPPKKKKMAPGSARDIQSLRKTDPIHICASSRVEDHGFLHFLRKLGKILFSTLKVHLIFSLTRLYGHPMVAVHPLRATYRPLSPVRTHCILKASSYNC